MSNTTGETPPQEPPKETKGEQPAAATPEAAHKVESFEAVENLVAQQMQETDAAVVGIDKVSDDMKAKVASKGKEMTASETAKDNKIRAMALKEAQAEAAKMAELVGKKGKKEDYDAAAELIQEERSYSLDKAQAEAAKMAELVGKKGKKEDYDAAQELLAEEQAAQKAADAKRIETFGDLTEAEIDKALEPLKEMREELPESPEMQALRREAADLHAKIEEANKTESMNFRGGEAGKKIALETLNRKLEQLQDKMADQVDKEHGVEKLGAVESAAADVLKKEGFVDIAPAEILKTLDSKDVAKIQELLNKGDEAGLKELLEKQMDKVAAGSEAKDRLAEIKGDTVASMQEVLKRTMDEQVSAKVFSMMSFREKASVFAGPILKKVGLNVGLGLAAGFGAAALVGTGGAAALVAGGAMAGWRLVENSAWGKKMLSKIGLGGPNTKKFDELRQKAQEMIIKDVLTSEKISAMASSVIRRESSKKLVADLKKFGEEGKKVDSGDEKDLEKYDKALSRVNPEFFRSALAKIKAERPELSAEQQKEAAVLIAVTTGRFERGQAMEDQLRNKLQKEKPGVFAALDKFSAIRSGTAGDQSKDRLFFGALTVALGATTASVARHSRWGRAVVSGIAGGMAGYALGKRAEAKAEARVVEESDMMVEQAEKALVDIDFPSEKLDAFRQDAAQIMARLDSGMLDRYPALKERAENFVYQVDQLEMKNRQNMDQLLETMTKTNDQVASTREADLAKLDKIYRSGQRRKVLYTLGGMAAGAVMGYYAQDAVQYMKKQMGLAVGQEAAPAKPGEQRADDPLEPQRGEAGHSEEPPPVVEQPKLSPEQLKALEMERTLAALGTIRKGDGVTQTLSRQLEANAQQFGFKGDVTNTAAVHRWAVLESRRLAIENNYLNPADGSQVRVRFDAKDPAQYLVRQEVDPATGKMHLRVEEQHTAGHEYMWKPKPPSPEQVVEHPPGGTVEQVPKPLPKEWQEDLQRLQETGSDPALEERLRQNLARGNQSPEDVAWLKSELGKRFEMITGEVKAKQAELLALQELKAKTTNPDLLRQLTAQEETLKARVKVLNETGEAYHRSFLQSRETPQIIDQSTGRQPIKPAIPRSMVEGAGEIQGVELATQYHLTEQARQAMVDAHMDNPEAMAALVKAARKEGLGVNQMLLAESWSRQTQVPGNLEMQTAQEEALRRSLLDYLKRPAMGGDQRIKLDLGNGRQLEIPLDSDNHAAARWALEHKLGVKLGPLPAEEVVHQQTEQAAVDTASMTPETKALWDKLGETPFAGGRRVSLDSGTQASIVLDGRGHPKVVLDIPKNLNSSVPEGHFLADNWRAALSKSSPEQLSEIRAAAVQAHYAEQMITKLKATDIAQTAEGRNLLGNLERDMRAARVRLVMSIDQAALREVGEERHRSIIEQISKLAIKGPAGPRVEQVVDAENPPANVLEQQAGGGVTNVASKVEVKTLTSGIGGSVEQFSAPHGRANFVYDTFGRIKGLQQSLEMRLGPADDAAMREQILRPDWVQNMKGGNPSLVRSQIENAARSIYAHEQMATELAKAGKASEAEYLRQIADDMRFRASERLGDVFVPPGKK